MRKHNCLMYLNMKNVNDNKIINIDNEINTVKIENKYFMIYEIGPKF